MAVPKATRSYVGPVIIEPYLANRPRDGIAEGCEEPLVQAESASPTVVTVIVCASPGMKMSFTGLRPPPVLSAQWMAAPTVPPQSRCPQPKAPRSRRTGACKDARVIYTVSLRPSVRSNGRKVAAYGLLFGFCP
jgi:hypothetical protein